MRRVRSGVVGLVAALGCTVPVAAAEPAGFALTIEVPETYRDGVPFTVSGYLYAHAEAPIVFEYARGVPNQIVEIVVDGEVAAADETNADGYYTATLTFDWRAPTTRTIQARAYPGYPIEEVSAPKTTRLHRVVGVLEIRPGSLSLAPGDSGALRAWAEDDNGRFYDVTAEATWSSADTDVATVSNAAGTKGIVTGGAPGTTTITATFRDLTQTAEVTVLY